MNSDSNNSLFAPLPKSIKVMILIPHEDDETNAAGVLLNILSKWGTKPVIVYTTNGDWKYPFQIRFQEALKAVSCLGLGEDQIIFLGYGDAINNDKKDHLFYSKNIPVESSSGHKETYGMDKYQDYAFIESGRHHSYTAANYLEDIISVIENYMPDLIVCTGFDEHPDHRMLSLCLDKAIGILRRNHHDYHPCVWKSLAYAFAYTAIADLTSINNPSTMRPEVGQTGKYLYDLVNMFGNNWDSRVRIPAPSACRNIRLSDNLIAETLRQHKSQYIITHADRIINGDEVFFSRRTDNLGFYAIVIVSSGDGRYLNDHLIYNVKDIDQSVPDFCDYYWQPDDSDNEKKATFKWDTPVQIEKLQIYGSASCDSGINELSILLSDGSSKTVSGIPANGNPLVVEFDEPHSITQCSIVIRSYYGNDYGISECEFFSEKNEKTVFPSYCKLMINGNFAYNYLLDKEVEKLPVDIYRYGYTDNLTVTVTSGLSKLEDGILLIDKDDREIHIRLQSDDNSIWDEISVTRLAEKEFDKYYKTDKENKFYLQRMRKAYKIHNMFYILKRQGVFAVVKRTINNVIFPILKWRVKRG